MSEETGAIKRHKGDKPGPERMSKFRKMMLNQGVVEQTLIDYLDEKQRVRVEWRKRAESLHIANASDNDAKEFPVIVGVKRLKKDGK